MEPKTERLKKKKREMMKRRVTNTVINVRYRIRIMSLRIKHIKKKIKATQKIHMTQTRRPFIIRKTKIKKAKRFAKTYTLMKRHVQVQRMRRTLIN